MDSNICWHICSLCSNLNVNIHLLSFHCKAGALHSGAVYLSVCLFVCLLGCVATTRDVTDVSYPVKNSPSVKFMLAPNLCVYDACVVGMCFISHALIPG